MPVPTRVLTRTGYTDWIVKEAIEIQLHPKNFNRDKVFNLSQSCKSATNILLQSRVNKQQLKDGSLTACRMDINV
jgi:hypothetical protein